MKQGRYKIGSMPHKGKTSFSKRCYMKWKRLDLWWRRNRDSEIRKQQREMMERKNPFHPSNRSKNR